MVKITVKIEGMMCPMCEAHATECVKKNFKVKSAESSHINKETVIVAESAIDRETLKSVIEEQTGYKVNEIYEEQIEKKGLFSSLFGKKA